MGAIIRKFDPDQWEQAFGVRAEGLFPWEDTPNPPFGSALLLVKPGESTEPHNHHEVETWFILQGRGVFDTDGREVERGDAIYIPPFSQHTLANRGDEDLLFLTVYWEDMSLTRAEPVVDETEGEAEAEPAERPRRVLATATPPTPNGDLHIGHLSGPYLAADVFNRYARMRGRESYYLSGIDDHQSYTAFKGLQTGLSGRQVADRFGAAMYQTLAAAGIETDAFDFPRTSPHHRTLVDELFTKLYREGKIVAKDAPTLFCESCDRYLFEVHVVGKCPHCGSGSCGNSCEDCGRPNDCVDLVDARCNFCQGEPVERTVRRLYFPLGPYRDQLAEYVAGANMNAHLRSMCDRMIADGLPDISISNVAEWGLPVPFEGFEGQKLYAWAEMAAGYLAATQELASRTGDPEGWRAFWCDGDVEIVQFFGFDNGYFHAVLFPALFFAYDDAIQPPKTFVVNEFYKLDGLKFSTSRMHLIWGRDLLNELPPDMVRFYLSYTAPETEQTNFTRRGMYETLDRELVSSWSAWLTRLGRKVAEEYGGKAPATGLWTADQRRFYHRLQHLIAEAAEAYEAPTFSQQRATRALCELVRTARRFAADGDHWRGTAGRGDERRTSIALELVAAKTLALLSAPVMPEFARRLWRDLGQDGPLTRDSWGAIPRFLDGGCKIDIPSEPYFRLEDEGDGATTRPVAA